MKTIHIKLIHLMLITCTLMIILIPQPQSLLAQDGTVTGSMGHPDDAYLEFTLTGADLKLREGTTNHYEGPWTGGPITLSGKMIVTRSSDPIKGGSVSYARLYGYLVDQSHMFKWPQDENFVLVQNRTETQEASITYNVPADYNQPTVEGKVEVEICGANACGKLEFFFHIDMIAERQQTTPVETLEPTTQIWEPVYNRRSDPPLPCAGDSGARFTEFDGQVLVFCGTDPEDENPAERDMVLLCNHHIKTYGNSSAIVGFTDMSTFTMKPRSEVILDTCEPRKSNLAILWGNIKVNARQMIEKGTLDVTMNQAVAGIKGTVFVAEETGETSILKVIEGEMWFQSLATGEMVDVVAGQMVSADDTGLSPITTFDVAAELATWPDDQNLDWSDFTRPSQTSWLGRLLPDFLRNPPLWVGILVLLFGLAGLGLFAFLVFNRSVNKNEASKQSSKAVRIVLLTGLVSISCLVSLCGVGGLYLNLSQSKSAAVQTSLDQSQSSLSQTETALGIQQTQIALALQATALAQPTDVPLSADEPDEAVPPAMPPTEQPVDIPEPTADLSSPDKPLTGSQYLTDHRFVDDFSSEALGWQVKDDGVTVLRYENQAYRFILQEKRGFKAVYLPVAFHPKDILFEVQGPANAHEGTFGVICQLQDAENYYYVDFDFQAGRYAIQQVVNGELVPLTIGSDYWLSSSAFSQPATAVNRIYIGCYLGDIQLNINDEVVDIVFIEQPFTKTGPAAFFLYTYEDMTNPNFQVLIDNVEAYDPVQ
ncbi:MAG: FecR domain-containing protein [Brevefilum sp.]